MGGGGGAGGGEGGGDWARHRVGGNLAFQGAAGYVMRGRGIQVGCFLALFMSSFSSSPFALLRLMRPHQWLKNAFVFAGLVFSQSWQDPVLALRVLYAFAAFCCVSSLVYIVNDWHDRASDALHPTKRHRPLASGEVSGAAALALAAILLAAGLWLAAGNRTLLLLLGAYALLNLAYSWRLKQVPVVDVAIIAAGFKLRSL